MNVHPNLERLMAYNAAVLDQALQVVAAYAQRPDADYSSHVGPHLRHVIEHYSAFMEQLPDRVIDYDARARDPAAEQRHAVADERIRRLKAQLTELAGRAFPEPVAVHMRGGLAGEEALLGHSTVSRELMFLASHAVHHYALIRVHAMQQGIDLGADFGKAPSTLRHERQR